MKTVTYIIYILLCAFTGVVCAKADINLKDWKYWAILCSLVGSYLCGKCQ